MEIVSHISYRSLMNKSKSDLADLVLQYADLNGKIHKAEKMLGETNAAQLAMLLAAIEANDEKYGVRYRLVLHALAVATALNYAAGVRIDPKEPDWPVAFIELPTGQVSWHIPAFPMEWDEHTTEQKYERCRAFTKIAFD